jgi:hypothetical protein
LKAISIPSRRRRRGRTEVREGGREGGREAKARAGSVWKYQA